MQSASVKKLLKDKRQDLREWRDQIKNTVMVCGFIIFPLLIVIPVLILQPVLEPIIGPAETWFDFKGIVLGSPYGVIIMLLMVTLCIIGPLWLAPMWIDRCWSRQYKRIFKLLNETDLAQMLLDDSALVPLWVTLERQPLLQMVASRRPETIDHRIEVASDYWRAMLMIAGGRQRSLGRAVFWGNATRLINDIAPIIYNTCVSLIILVVLAPLIIFVLPLWITVLGLTILQQACQAAMLDYFINQTPNPLIENDID